MGVKSTLIASPVTNQHQSAAQQRGVNASGLFGAFQEAVTELIFLAKEVIKPLPQGTLVASGTISTSSPNVPIVGIIPPFVVPGLQVTDLTTGQILGRRVARCRQLDFGFGGQ